jgi:NADH dehydrogenase [ubiquinone] 1 alpha subcomplex assembly factor 7
LADPPRLPAAARGDFVTALAALLRQRIATEGPLRLDDYMQAALQHPQSGYYRERDPLGAAGDFITAPEISQVFGELIGLWTAAVWDSAGRPRPFQLVELGPGRGTLIADALRAISRTCPPLAAALALVLVETSRPLRAEQAQALAGTGLASPPVWCERIEEVGPAPAVILANEFIDSLPIRQLVFHAGGWRERRVGCDAAGEFRFVSGELVADARADELPALDGDIFEVCEAAEALAARLSGRVCASGGAALIIDFGHPRTATGETLQAVRRHRFASPLHDPGEVDLAHAVDFARLRAAAAGACCYGPIPQGLFLGRLNIAERTTQLTRAAPDRAAAIEGAVRRLVHPGRMGVLFQVLAITGPDLAIPPGFTAADRSRR